MVDAVHTALSGLQANTERVRVAANNIANAGNIGALDPTDGPAPYTPQDVVAIADPLGGVQAQVIARDPAYVPAPDANSPYANDQGVVAVPNVDLAEEIVDLNLAKTAYAANALALRVAGEMQDELLKSFDERV
jgi:flagellar basal-body rod protein FlgC